MSIQSVLFSKNHIAKRRNSARNSRLSFGAMKVQAPIEVWDHILASVPSVCDDLEWSRTLRAFARTSHVSCELAQRHLFHHITIFTAHKRQNVEQYIEFFVASPHIALLVRSVEIDTVPHIPSHWCKKMVFLDLDQMPRLLSVLPQLRRLSLIAFLVNRSATPFNFPLKNLDCLKITLSEDEDEDEGFQVAPPPSATCMAVTIFRLLSLFGSVGELRLASSIYDVCACDTMPEENDSTKWFADKYLSAVLGLHQLEIPSALAIQALDLGSPNAPFPAFLLLKALPHTASLQVLTSVVLLCADPKDLDAYGEILDLCGHQIINCEIILDAHHEWMMPTESEGE